MFLTILFYIISLVTSAVLFATSLEALYAASSPVFLAVPYFSDRFLANDKDPYPLRSSLVLGFIDKQFNSVY